LEKRKESEGFVSDKTFCFADETGRMIRLSARRRRGKTYDGAGEDTEGRTTTIYFETKRSGLRGNFDLGLTSYLGNLS